MKITVNGAAHTFDEGTSVADLVAQVTGEADPKGIAVAIDRCVVPRSEWPTTYTHAGSILEIVTAAPGG